MRVIQAIAAPVPAATSSPAPPEGRPDRRLPAPPRLLKVGLDSGDEHQQEDPDFRQALDDARQVRLWNTTAGVLRKHFPTEDVQEARTEHEPREDLAAHRRLAEAGAQRAGPFRGDRDQAQEKEDLQDVAHDNLLHSEGPLPGTRDRGPPEGDRGTEPC